MTNKPLSISKLEQLKKIAKNKNVELIIGNHEEQVIQLRLLEKIL